MKNNKQTAVDWLIKQMVDNWHNDDISLTDLYEQAKQMEKEQINSAFYDGYYQESLYDARQYYDDTYGPKGS